MASYHPYGEHNHTPASHMARVSGRGTPTHATSSRTSAPGQADDGRHARLCLFHAACVHAIHVKNPHRLSMLQTRHTGPQSPQAHASRTNGVAAPPMIAVSRSNSSKNNKSRPNGTLGDPHKHHQTTTSVATRHALSLRHRLWDTERYVQPRGASCTQHAKRPADPMSGTHTTVYHGHPRLGPP